MSEAGLHLIGRRRSLLLCEPIFEVYVDKTTPKCCITSCQRFNHKELGDKLDPSPGTITGEEPRTHARIENTDTNRRGRAHANTHKHGH